MKLSLNIDHKSNNTQRLTSLLSCTYCKNRYLKNDNCIYKKVPELDIYLCVTWRPMYELVY